MHTNGLFITGTDTGVGKTAVAVAITKATCSTGKRVGVYKPVASGVVFDGRSDIEQLWEAAGKPLSLHTVCPQSFEAAIAPVQAALMSGKQVDETLLRDGILPWLTCSDFLVVEGTGGLFSPLGRHSLNSDVARDLRFPLIIVDDARLGMIGRTLATVRAAQAEGLPIHEVVISHTGALSGSLNDPCSKAGLVHDGMRELVARLEGIPVKELTHGASVLTTPT